VTGNTITGGVTVQLVSGTTVLASTRSGSSSFDLTPQTLSSGNYAVTIQHYSIYTGNVNISLSSP
jgi:hypothetical protein